MNNYESYPNIYIKDFEITNFWDAILHMYAVSPKLYNSFNDYSWIFDEGSISGLLNFNLLSILYNKEAILLNRISSSTLYLSIIYLLNNCRITLDKSMNYYHLDRPSNIFKSFRLFLSFCNKNVSEWMINDDLYLL